MTQVRLTNNGNLFVTLNGLSFFQTQQGKFLRFAKNESEVNFLTSKLNQVFSTAFKICSNSELKSELISDFESEEFQTIGILDSKVYGPYTEESLEMRESSNTNYADRLVSIPSSLVCWVEDFLNSEDVPVEVQIGMRHYL